MEQPDVELGALRGELAFHQARLRHVLLERAGRAGASLAAQLAQARERLAEGSLERRAFDQAAADPWSDLQRRLAAS